MTNLTVFEALILIFCSVLGFTPVRALRKLLECAKSNELNRLGFL